MHCSLIVRDGDTLQLGSCVNCEPCCAFFKTGHRHVLELNFEPCQNNLQASVHACLTERGYVRERRILRISSQISDLKAHPAFRPRGHDAGLWVSHWLQSFKQSKTGKTRRGFYTWLPFVSVQQHAGRPPRVEPSSCEDTSLSKIKIKVSVLELKMQKYTSSWKDDTGEDANVVQSHVKRWTHSWCLRSVGIHVSAAFICPHAGRPWTDMSAMLSWKQVRHNHIMPLIEKWRYYYIGVNLFCIHLAAMHILHCEGTVRSGRVMTG